MSNKIRHRHRIVHSILFHLKIGSFELQMQLRPVLPPHLMGALRHQHVNLLLLVDADGADKVHCLDLLRLQIIHLHVDCVVIAFDFLELSSHLLMFLFRQRYTIHYVLQYSLEMPVSRSVLSNTI